jgi:ATP-dependent helicase/nuclease subunit A
MRLFYVALTRAKQKLFISFKLNDKTFKSIDKLCKILSDNKGNIKLSAMKADRMSDWIWLTLIKHNKFKDIADIIGYYFNYDYDNKLSDDVFEYEYMKKESQAIFEAAESLPESDENIIKEINDIITFKYDNSLSQTPAKLSVTQIAKKVDVEKDFFSISLERPDFIEKKLKGNERGTAIHTFLQYCSFENAINDTEAEIWRLCDNGYLSEQEASIIPIEKIKAFFTSKLYNRIKNSVDVTREMKFMVALNELEFDEETTNKFRNADGMIKGIMDLVFEENGSLVLVDYKSDRTYNENLLIDKYKLQLNLYKQALEIITGKKVSEVYIYSVEMEKEILLA